MTLEQLTKPLTRAEVEAAIYAALAAKGVSTTSWKTGSPTRTLIVAFAFVMSAFSKLSAEIAKSGFLELSSGDWLAAVAKYVYGVDKDTGAFATGNLTLTNTAGGVYSGVAGDLIASNPTTGKTYRNTAAYNIAAGSVGTPTVVTVPFQAVELGTGSTSTPGTITTLVTALNGVAVTNAAALVGRDAESDAALRLRCQEKIGTLSPNGPRDAYSFVAKSAKRADGSAIGVTRVRVIADGNGSVTVYVATASGTITGTAGDPATDLGAVNDAIQKKCAPLGVTATLVAATAKTIAPTYQLWVQNTSGLTDDQIKTAVATALTNYLATIPIGGLNTAGGYGFVYFTALESVIGGANPTAPTVRVLLTVPAADVTIAVSEAPVLGAVVATVTQVSGGVV